MRRERVVCVSVFQISRGNESPEPGITHVSQTKAKFHSVDGRVPRQMARKPRRDPPSWNMMALIQGGPHPRSILRGRAARQPFPPSSLFPHSPFNLDRQPPSLPAPRFLSLSLPLFVLLFPRRPTSLLPTIIRVVALRYTPLLRNCKAAVR